MEPDDELKNITEIVRRSAQGVSLPFLCRASDNHLYWVKGAMVGKKSLCCELISGYIARVLQLPIPEFGLFFVTEGLINDSLIEGVNELGHGIVFGSRHFDGAQELTYENALHAIKKNSELCCKVLVFDWWINNGDRILGENAGNPNILWSAEENVMKIIDHGLAFDDQWDETQFFNDHVFREARSFLRDTRIADNIENTMTRVLNDIDNIWEGIPEEWLFLDKEKTMPNEFNLLSVTNILGRIRSGRVSLMESK